jgi:hypothetical protein
MKHRYYIGILTAITISLSFHLRAQDNVPELVTDRPDQTESASVVPLKSLQIETGFIREFDATDLAESKNFAYNTTLLRYGFFENTELRIGIEYLGEKITYLNIDSTSDANGLSPLYAGFKTKIVNENGLLPEIAFLGALNLPATAGTNFKPTYTSATMRFSLAHTLSPRFSLGYNLGAEWDGESANAMFFYTLSFGAEISNKIGAFIEVFGTLPEKGLSSHLTDAGITYLVVSNLQLDISVGLALNNNAPDNFISFGFSWRIPE